MYVEGKVLSTDGSPIPGALIDTWETNGHGAYSDVRLVCGQHRIESKAHTQASTTTSYLSARGRIAGVAFALILMAVMAIVQLYPFRIPFLVM